MIAPLLSFVNNVLTTEDILAFAAKRFPPVSYTDGFHMNLSGVARE